MTVTTKTSGPASGAPAGSLPKSDPAPASPRPRSASLSKNRKRRKTATAPDSTAPDTAPPAAASSAAASRDRTDFALGLIRAGLSDQRILETLCEEGCSLRRARNCLDRAYRLLERRLTDRTPQQRLAGALELRNAIVEKALADDDFRIALSAADSRDKLADLASAAEGEAGPATLIDLIRRAVEPEAPRDPAA